MADRVFQTGPAFDPAHAEHQFTLVGTDAHLALFGRALTGLMREVAPGVRVHFQHLTSQIVRRAQEDLRTVDGILLPQGLLATVPSIDLYDDRWVCVMASESLLPQPMTPAELAGPRPPRATVSRCQGFCPPLVSRTCVRLARFATPSLR